MILISRDGQLGYMYVEIFTYIEAIFLSEEYIWMAGASNKHKG